MKNWKKAIALRQSPKPINRAADDIPEVTRDLAASPVQRDWVRISLLTTGGLGLCAIAVLGSVLLAAQMNPPEPSTAADASEDAPAATDDPPPETVPEVENVLGHLPYEMAPTAELQSIAGSGSIQLRSPA
ncbi:MAG: hypothetical protein SVX43_23435, partial [Cyanobacteriota bacterium]|nr:hypothetical protein [Cyanobacteriota bacterium]